MMVLGPAVHMHVAMALDVTHDLWFKCIGLNFLHSGIDATHYLFEGRANRGVDFVDDPPPSNGDPHGHGTHVAGKII